jgi:serine/threonine protein kinase
MVSLSMRKVKAMEDRYEILGKIGQGGLGAVYRGFDTRMNREVAIKRISTVADDPELQEESTKQLVKEAGALASLQHPNIVTIHDVGSDADGPYVVMELINGKTLDELIEHAPLTWSDFKELAMQTQEALIAAQERNLIHSDLKPSNLMLTWLPSGKFQIKIVDFGLASLAQSQSKHDLESIDVVFGSIFFMPPEQFERKPLDMRSDMYSIGCVYYQALTGHYPFDGKTGNEVMDAHMHHKVTPLKEVRAGIPLWACDWIMWHLNRFPQDRPESARDALSLFLQNERIPNTAMSLGVPQTSVGPPRPRMRNPVPMNEKGTVPPGNGPATQALARAKMVQTSQVPTPGNEPGAITQTAPQPLAPPEGFKPSVHTAVDEPPLAQDPARHAAGHHGSHTQRMLHPEVAQKKPFKLTKAAKIGISVAAAVLLLILGIVFMKIRGANRDAGIVEDILANAETSGVTEVAIDTNALQLTLLSLTQNESDSNVQRVCAALAIAKPTDSADVDARVADFVTKGPLVSVKTRESLIGDVLRARNNPVIMPAMLDLAFSNSDPAVVVAALQSVRQMMGDGHFGKLLQLVSSTNNNLVRDAAEANIAEILRKSQNPDDLTRQLTSAKESSFKPDVQRTLLRLISLARTLSPSKN